MQMYYIYFLFLSTFLQLGIILTKEGKITVKEDIKMLLAKKSMTITELVKRLSTEQDIITVQSISKKLSKQTIKFEEVRKILDILGYEIEYKEK